MAAVAGAPAESSVDCFDWFHTLSTHFMKEGIMMPLAILAYAGGAEAIRRPSMLALMKGSTSLMPSIKPSSISEIILTITSAPRSLTSFTNPGSSPS